MAPKILDQKRKRGRPPGASRPAQDASGRDAADGDEDHDAEDELPPRKRGRKAKQDKGTVELPLALESSLGQPGERDRPPKTKEQHTAEEAVPAVENKERAVRKPEKIAGERVKPARGMDKAAKAPADEDPPSSEPRRDGRERRARRPDVVLGTSRPLPSSRHTATTNSDPKSHPTKQTEPASDPPSSTPRRSARERRAWDPARVFGSRLSDEDEAKPQAAEQARPKKRSRAPQEGAAASRARGQMPTTEDAVVKRRRGRPFLDGNEISGEGPSRQRRTKQKAAEEAQALRVAQAEGAAQPKRRGRPRAVDVAQEQDSESRQSSSSRARHGKAPKSRGDQEPAPANRKRKALASHPPKLQVDEASSESGDEQQLSFRHLQESIRDIPRSTIAKWNSLDPPSINAVSAFLGDAQRPVLLRLQDTNRRREHASAALSQISRRVRTKLAKGLPFPPPTGGFSTRANAGSYEDEFDFERTVDAVQTMENTLNPLLHSLGLLAREIEREEDALAKEFDALHKLETNAKAKAKEWKNSRRREHVLAPGMKSKDDGEGRGPGDRLELVPAVDGEVVGGLFKGLEDELIVLSKQIGSHMESMKGNLQQIGGVVPAITKSKAALQQVLLKHLDDEQYESILLGYD